MKRALIRLEDVASRDNLAWAFWRAARGKRHRSEVLRFAADLDRNLDGLQADILHDTVEVGRFHCFEIRDPKQRTIHAPRFRERVLHHALMAHVEPVFERYLVNDTFACRPGKGSRAAVERVQWHIQRLPWFLQMDVRSYFASIDHAVLREVVRRRIKGKGVLRLIDRIIKAHETAPGRGLPIGALTSQHFANLYLASLDRYLLESLRVSGFVRYMDDMVVWGLDDVVLREVAESAIRFVSETLLLTIKPTWQLQRSCRGITFSSLRIFPGRIRLTARRKRRYRQARAKWETAFRCGTISASALQSGYASALAITRDAEATAWRRRQLVARPPVDA